jgi:DNA polymerase (family 10)
MMEQESCPSSRRRKRTDGADIRQWIRSPPTGVALLHGKTYVRIVAVARRIRQVGQTSALLMAHRLKWNVEHPAVDEKHCVFMDCGLTSRTGTPAPTSARGVMSEGPARLDRLAVARALREMADLLALAGDEPFKARAYERGARVLESLSADLARLVDEGRLTELRGIGSGLAAAISELHLTGRSRALDKLRQQLPPGALDLSQVPELSLKKIAALHDALGIETIAQLEAACEAGRLRTVKGIGARTEQRILDSIRRLQDPAPVRVLLHHALALADPLLAHLRDAPGVRAVELAGSLRRWTEAVESLVFVLVAGEPAPALEHAFAFPLVARVIAREPSMGRAVLTTGLSLEVRVVPSDRQAVELLYATGAPAHVEHLEWMAGARGLRLERSGLVGAADRVRVPTEGEADLYRRLGLPHIPPELREDEGELEAAAAGRLPADLVTLEDVRGLVHCHTVYSDGKHTVEQMARAADALGMPYLTITDHSPTASYAGGLGIDRLKAQWDEITRVQETVGVRLLRGTESDILGDGSLDYPDAVLERLDVVIASIHSRLRMDADQMTRRLVRAMAQPLFKIWGHALGRLVLSRPPIDCHVEDVLDVVAASRAAVEINGDPHRLDMEPRWIRAARGRGIRFVISTDAHSVAELGNLRYGVAMARRGWVRRGEVLNTLDVEGFARAVSPSGRA